MRIAEFTEQGKDFADRGLSVQRDRTGAQEPQLPPAASRRSAPAPSAGASTSSTSNEPNDDASVSIDTDAPPGTVVPNQKMNPLFSMRSASRLAKSNAARIMKTDTLPKARQMAGYYGDTVTVNDAIAKAGTSRERNTPNSQHFNGTALDISTSGMTNEQKMRLFRAAQQAGFTGFGFGRNILHVDTGPRRHWAYGNSEYGGKSIASLGQQVRSGTTTA